MSETEATRIFARMEQAYADMAAFLAEEREHLLAPDWEALTADQERREALSEAIAAVDAERRALAQSLGLPPHTPFKELLPADGDWQERRASLRHQVAAVQETNRENTRLLKAALERNEHLVALLTGLPDEGGYTAGGEAAGAQLAGVMSRKV
jgi:flagellar biosynthesis/type III secretory pathway chaperone